MMSDIEKAADIKLFFMQELEKGHLLGWNDLYQKIIQREYDDQLRKSLKNWYDNLTTFPFLKEIAEDVEELYIHTPECSYMKTHSDLKPFYHEYTHDDINLLFSFLSLSKNQSWNYNNPFVSFNLDIKQHFFRVTLIHQCLNPEGYHKAFFRVIQKKPFNLQQQNHFSILENLISTKKNILISGSTGSGKTSLINSMLEQVNPNEHVVILEDTYELSSPNPRTSRLLSKKEVTLDELLTYALRMSPDRIILGEIRSNEVLTYLLALNTGHNGLISSLHANNAKDAIIRMALLYLTYTQNKLDFDMVLKLICQNIDCVIHMENKKIVEIIDVYGSEKNNIFFDSLI